MGTLSPFVQGNSKRRNFLPLATLVLGFLCSAYFTYLLLSFVSLKRRETDVNVANIGFAILVAALIIMDVRTVFHNAPCSFGVSRQTPASAFTATRSAAGTFVWGLDTGTSFSTYRVTTATWVLAGAVFFGRVGGWIGLVYAAGFTVPLVIATVMNIGGTGTMPHRLSTLRRKVQTVSILLQALLLVEIWRPI